MLQLITVEMRRCSNIHFSDEALLSENPINAKTLVRNCKSVGLFPTPETDELFLFSDLRDNMWM